MRLHAFMFEQATCLLSVMAAVWLGLDACLIHIPLTRLLIVISVDAVVRSQKFPGTCRPGFLLTPLWIYSGHGGEDVGTSHNKKPPA